MKQLLIFFCCAVLLTEIFSCHRAPVQTVTYFNTEDSAVLQHRLQHNLHLTPPAKESAIGNAMALAPVVTQAPVKLPLIVIDTTGRITNRVNVYFLADGFINTKFDSLKFINACISMANAIKARAPYSWYHPWFNFYASFTHSKDTLIGNTNAANGALIKSDTYLGSWMGYDSIARFMNCNNVLVNNIVAGTMPYADVTCVVANTTIYAGAQEGAIAISTLASSCTEIMIHESGHALGGLGDEYAYGGCGYVPEWNSVATDDTAFARAYWGDTWVNWLPGDGKYNGADYCPQGLRDSGNCEMNNLAQPFCPQCKKRFIYSYNYYVNPIDATYPVTGATSCTGFSLKLLQNVFNTMQTKWYVNGILKQTGGATLTLPAGTYKTVSVTAYDTCKWLFKTAAPQYTASWANITVTSATPPPPAPTINPVFDIDSIQTNKANDNYFAVYYHYPANPSRVKIYATGSIVGNMYTPTTPFKVTMSKGTYNIAAVCVTAAGQALVSRTLTITTGSGITYK